MFCPRCRDEFRNDVQKCPDCDVVLVHRLEPEAPPRLLAIDRTMDPDRLAAVVERLESADVPYVIEAGTGLKILDEDDDSEPRAEAWEARIYVPGFLQDRAAELLSGVAEANDIVPGRFTERVLERMAGVEPSPEDALETPTERLDPASLVKPFDPR